MSWHKYFPSYAKVYPSVHIDPDVLSALRRSDRKIKYMEYDLKVETPIKDADGNVIGYQSSREDSYERLLGLDKQFVSDACSMDEAIEAQEEGTNFTAALIC